MPRCATLGHCNTSHSHAHMTISMSMHHVIGIGTGMTICILSARRDELNSVCASKWSTLSRTPTAELNVQRKRWTPNKNQLSN